MPYRPPKVGQSPYDATWRKQRLALLREQPLCRLCLAAGRTVAATVADHIVPLADGGTNETDNLQPLCKRCHDAVKTPADRRARVAAIECEAVVTEVRQRSWEPATVNGIELRYALAQRMSWPRAHEVALACLDGIARACRAGEIRGPGVRIVLDDCRAANALRDRYSIPVRRHDDQVPDETGDNDWVRAHRSNERAARSAENSS
jgi:5-methylcytosine-specific restriction protein A